LNTAQAVGGVEEQTIMLGAFGYRLKRLMKRLARACWPQKSPAVPETGREVIAALDNFFDRERSYDGRNELFAALTSRFAGHNPVQSQVRAMFNAVLENIVVPMHHSFFWGDRMLTLDKAAGFLEDDDFRRSYDAIRGSHIYDAYDPPHTIAWRLHTLVWAARSAIAHPGDLVECGVFKGDMSWVVASVLGDKIADRSFYLYDSFGGFSPKLSSAADFPDNPGFLKMANDIYSDPTIYDTVVKKFANMPHVKIIRGFVPDTFKIALPERIAFLHVDLNSPAAEIAALEHLFDRVVSGGYIVFDDYGWKQFKKQRDAENRFMADRGHYIFELPTGQGLVIKQ
jgi:O-methyltransferase